MYTVCIFAGMNQVLHCYMCSLCLQSQCSFIFPALFIEKHYKDALKTQPNMVLIFLVYVFKFIQVYIDSLRAQFESIFS